VDPPGEPPSEPSVAVVDDCGFEWVWTHILISSECVKHEARSSGEPEQLLEPLPVKADDHLAIDDGHGRRTDAELQQLFERLLVFTNVLGRKGDTLLRKKLFLLVTGGSSGLRIDDDLLCHDFLLESCPLQRPCFAHSHLSSCCYSSRKVMGILSPW